MYSPRRGPAGFELIVLGESGSRGRLQASTNFNPVAWIDLIAFTNTQSTISLTDTTAATYPFRFYRVVSP